MRRERDNVCQDVLELRRIGHHPLCPLGVESGAWKDRYKRDHRLHADTPHRLKLLENQRLAPFSKYREGLRTLFQAAPLPSEKQRPLLSLP